LESGKIPIRISKIALYNYLAVHYVPGDMCIIKGTKKLLPGHYLEFDVQNFTLKIVEYWDLKERNFIEREYDDYVNFVKKLVEDAVKMRMMSDVPLGLFLSGGIDSSIIASVMKKLNPEVNTFSIGFSNPDFDESKFSKLIAEEYGTNHHHFILEPEKIIELLPKVVRYMDEPSGDQALLPLYWLSHEAKKFVTVVLGGEGGDEIFGGYSYYDANSKKNYDQISTTQEILPEFFIENETLSGFPLISDFNMRSKLIKDFNMDELKN
jgi:asparagine synthase (glutamine-hydrolysing)